METPPAPLPTASVPRHLMRKTRPCRRTDCKRISYTSAPVPKYLLDSFRGGEGVEGCPVPPFLRPKYNELHLTISQLWDANLELGALDR
jgi:hypothetical protein